MVLSQLPINLKVTLGAKKLVEDFIDGGFDSVKVNSRRSYLRRTGQLQKLIDLVVAVEVYKMYTKQKYRGLDVQRYKLLYVQTIPYIDIKL